MRSPLVNFSIFYFLGGLLAIVAVWYFHDQAVAQFIGVAWLAVGIALALITIGNLRKESSEYAHLFYLIGFAWLVLLLVAGIVVIWTGGIGVDDLNRLLN